MSAHSTRIVYFKRWFMWDLWANLTEIFINHTFVFFFSFSLSIHYRFSPTRAPSPWDGVRISDKFSPVCPQRLPNIQNETLALEKMPKGRLEYLKRLLPFLQNQSEDCLYLNVFAPAHGECWTEYRISVVTMMCIEYILLFCIFFFLVIYFDAFDARQQ